MWLAIWIDHLKLSLYCQKISTLGWVCGAKKKNLRYWWCQMKIVYCLLWKFNFELSLLGKIFEFCNYSTDCICIFRSIGRGEVGTYTPKKHQRGYTHGIPTCTEFWDRPTWILWQRGLRFYLLLVNTGFLNCLMSDMCSRNEWLKGSGETRWGTTTRISIKIHTWWSRNTLINQRDTLRLKLIIQNLTFII